MAIRRQGWTVKWEDNGTTPISDLTAIENNYTSVFYENPGANNTLTSRNLTGLDQFLVLQYYGSTPGFYNQTTEQLDNPFYWCPGTYMNYVVGTTTYFQTLADNPYIGMPGSAAPFPISINGSQGSYRPILGDKTYIPIEIPPGTEWDILLTIVNPFIEGRQDLPCTSSTVFSWNVVGSP